MKALDTNVLVRLLVDDDQTQAQLSCDYLERAEAEGQKLFAPLVVVLELVWVWQAKYGYSRECIIASLKAMMGTATLVFEHHPALTGVVSAAIDSNADLADLIIGQAACFSGCDGVVTFDKRAARTPYFELLQP